MKKNRYSMVSIFLWVWKCKVLLAMRLTFLILLFCVLQSFAITTFSQNMKLSISQKDISIENIIQLIESKTDYYFMYSAKTVDVKRTVDIEVSNKLVSEVLDEIFKGTDTSYKIEGRLIALSKGSDVSSIEQQPRSISGKVTDSSGVPLPGVAIVVKGTTSGTITDFDGAYSIGNVPVNSILQFSFVGMKSQEIPVANKTSINIVLIEDAIGIDEVAVIGYGTQSKTKVTGSISAIKTQQFEKIATGNFVNALAGAITGVQINQNGTNPGEDSKLIIRGTGTLTAGSNPLIVVDGFPLSEGSSMSSVNPNDIESIDILKDAASAAIYGSRAANGVLLITTKKAKKEGLQIDVDVFAGVQTRSDNFKTIDAYDFALFLKEARDYAYTVVNPTVRKASDDNTTRLANGATRRQLNVDYIQPYLDGTPGLTNTNWWNEIYKPAGIQQYNVSIANRMDKTKLSASIGYLVQDGILIGTNTKKFTSNIKIDSDILKNLTLGMNLNTSYDQSGVIDPNTVGNTFPADPSSGVYLMWPFFKAYNEDGSFAISQQIRANTPADGALAENTVAMTLGVKNIQNRFRSFGSAYLEYKIFNGLVAKTSLGGDFRSTFIDYYQPSNIGTYRTDVVNNQANSSETNGRVENILTETTINYNKKLNKHSFDFLGGFSYQEENMKQTVVKATGIKDDNLENIAGGSSFAVNAYRQKWTQVSYFGRIQYDFDSKYLLSVSWRRDGSSRFGDNSKWGEFKSMSLGWLLSNERFFPKDSKISLAKIRASLGQTGNNQIGAYGSRALVGVDNYTIGGSLVPGFATVSSPNDNLSWETKISSNFGLDLGLFENKLLFTGEYYISTTKDLLLEVPVPQQSGFSSSLQNVGKVRNSGLEVELKVQNIKAGDFKLGFNGNLSTNKNKVLALGPDQDQIIKSISGIPFVTKVGGPIAEMYGYNIIGVYKSQTEIDNTPHLATTQVGDYIVNDTNGDGKINLDDRIELGTYNPKFIYAFGANMEYKDFDLSFQFTGVEGRSVYPAWTALTIESGEAFAPSSEYYFKNRYHPVDNPNGFFAQPNNSLSAARIAIRQSNYSVQSGDYLRLGSLQLGYNLPKARLEKLGISKLRLYLSGNNLFTITKFRGVNPEASNSDPLLQGYVQHKAASVPRTVTVGVRLTL